MNDTQWIRIAGVLGAMAVFVGAFGAHWFEKFPGVSEFSAEELTKSKEWLETGVRYHFYHTIAILAVGMLMMQRPELRLSAAGWCFLVGIGIFSGLLYVMAVTQMRILGAVVWIGGVLFIVGWLMLAVRVSSTASR